MGTQRATKQNVENQNPVLNLSIETETNKPTVSLIPVIKVTQKKEVAPKKEIVREEVIIPKEEIIPAKIPPLTISQITERSEKLHLLSCKYNTLQEKRKELERFKIAHNSNSAQMSIVDSQGLTFESSNPGSIGQVIKIWKEDFEKAIEATEAEMRTLIS